MNKTYHSSKITVTCPQGHRLQAGSLLVGKTVRCPKCHSKFVFAPTKTEPKKQPVTESGVMRILGEMPQAPAADSIASVPMRPCSRCGIAIPESLAVCSHCNCYVGVLPAFMRQMTPAAETELN